MQLSTQNPSLRFSRQYTRLVVGLFAGFFLGVGPPTACADTLINVSARQGGAGIQAALNEARRLRQSSPEPNAPIRIVLDPGEYTLSAPLILGPADAGTVNSPLVVEAKVPGTAVITGAAKLSFTQTQGSSWRIDLPGPASHELERTAGQLFVNGRRAVLARSPNLGETWLLESGEDDSLVATVRDVAALSHAVSGQEHRAVVHLMQSWTSGRHRVADFDAQTRKLRLDPKPRWPFLKFGPKQRFYLENSIRAFDHPGEWIASEGALLYRPTEADRRAMRAGTATAYFPRLSQLLLVKGTPDQPVTHLRIQGLTFAHTGIPLPSAGWVDNQAATGIAAAVEVNHASQVRFTDNRFHHLAGYGLWLREGVNGTLIQRNLMEDLGAGGIRVGTETTPKPANRTGANQIHENVVRDTGAEFPGAVAIWIGRSFGNTVSSNIVARTSYTAISVGWAWGYEEPSSGDNKVEGNVLFDIGQKQLSDMGAIYTLGRSPGTVIRGNFIRNVEDFVGYGAGAWGIYNDEGSTDLLVEDNVVVGTRSGGYQLHYGRDITVRGNLFAAGRTAEVRWANVSRSASWRFEDNGIGQEVAVSSPSRDGGSPSLARRQPFEFHQFKGDPGDPLLQSFAIGRGAKTVPVEIGAGMFEIAVRIAPNSPPASETQVTVWRATIENAQRLFNRMWQERSP